MSGHIRFGVYELDRETLDFRKHGVPIRLQEQPLQVLLALVERPGEIVTREQLQQRIWGQETFVDFEQSLNKAVNRLRDALSDDPVRPQYVETIPRRGYRFVAPVIPTPSTRAEAKPSPHLAASSHRLTFGFYERRLVKAATAVGVAIVISIAITVTWRTPPKEVGGQNIRHVATLAFMPTLSKDGRLIAYNSITDGGVSHVWVRQTNGGDAVQVTNGPDADFVSDVSPDGTLIVFYSDRAGGGVYTLSVLPSEQPRLIAKVTGYVHPRFSPDGAMLLYCVDSQVFTVAADGGQPLGLELNKNYRVDNALWSPTGKEVVFHGVHRSDAEEKPHWWVAVIPSPKATALNVSDLDAADFLAIRSWMSTPDGRSWIFYRAFDHHDSWKLLRVQVSSEGEVQSRPEMITSGTGPLESISMSTNGRIAYSTKEQNYHLFEIPLNSKGKKAGPTLQVVLGEEGDYLAPSISHDGKWLLYNGTRPGMPSSIFLRNLTTRMERLLDDKGHRPRATGDAATSIAADGSEVAFERICNPGQKWFAGTLVPDCTFTISLDTGETKQLCELCMPRGFSTNRAVLLVQKMERTTLGKGRDSIFLIDLASGAQKEFLSVPDADLYDAYFSWDDNWVVFKKLFSNSKSQIVIASVKNWVAADSSRWINLSDGRFSDDKPRFSADGNVVYFTSTRDGYLCIWGQRLNPVTKRAFGAAFPVEHFHNSLGRDADQAAATLGIARDKMIINLPQVNSEVWIAQVDQR